MKILKRFLFVSVLLFSIITTTSCSLIGKNSSSKNEYQLLKTMVLELPTGINVEVSHYGNDGKVFRQITKAVLPYKSLPGETREEAEKTLAPAIESYKNIKGITHKIEFGEDNATETLEVNFKELDLEKAKSVPGLLLDEDANNGISVEKSVEILKEKGFKEKVTNN